MEQQWLIDAGIYISANQLEQAAAICREILKNRPTGRAWIQSLNAEIEALLLSSRKPLGNSE